MPPSAPPGFAFAVVWPILYALAAVALWLQITSPTASALPGMQWTGVAIMALQLAIGFSWMPVFTAGYTKAATWIIVVMLMMTVTGLTLAAGTNGIAATLWAPYAAWLIFALVLSSQVNVIEAK